MFTGTNEKEHRKPFRRLPEKFDLTRKTQISSLEHTIIRHERHFPSCLLCENGSNWKCLDLSTSCSCTFAWFLINSVPVEKNRYGNDVLD